MKEIICYDVSTIKPNERNSMIAKRKQGQFTIAIIRSHDQELISLVNEIKSIINITHEQIYRRGIQAVAKERKISLDGRK